MSRATFWVKTDDFQRELLRATAREQGSAEGMSKTLGLSRMGLHRQAARLGLDLKDLLRAEPRSTLGANVRRLRRAKGWTLVELAKAAHSTKTTMAQLEGNPTYAPRLSTIQEVARALGCTLDNLTKTEGKS